MAAMSHGFPSFVERGSEMARIKFIVEGSGLQEVDAEIGRSIMENTKAHNFALEAACGGAMACATCHVIVSEDWADKLPPPSDEEESVLEFAFGIGEHSRLACQIFMSDELDGIEIHVPAPLSAPLSL